METKVCSKCGQLKDTCEFSSSKRNKNGLRGECKECQKYYYILNSEKLKSRRIERYNQNIEKEQTRIKNYYRENKEEIIKKLKIKKRENPTLRMISNLRSRIVQFVKSKKIHKDNKTLDLVGCSTEFLKEHLQSQFKDGMGWDNYGSWHIDHIIPLSSAKNIEEISKLCHYSNLQPLWASDNLSKGNKIIS
jgi:hypothetical protein